MNANFSLTEFWSQGDYISNFVATILIAMSVLTWTTILIKVIVHSRQKTFGKRVESFWHSSSFTAGLKALGKRPDNVFYILALDGVEAVQHLELPPNSQDALPDASQVALLGTPSSERQLHDQLNLSDWVTRALRNSVEGSLARLQAGLTFLASIGSTAPFIGLFGTVWGIYHALARIGASGQTSLDQVAGPIGEALVMTALGLAVAIPAVLAYNALVRTNKKIAGELNRFGYDLHAYLVTGARVNAKHSR
jgi:biopolymer transport protein ExbB